MKIREWLIGIVLFSLIVIGGMTFITQVGSDYDVPVEKDYNATYNKMSELTSGSLNLDSMKQDMQPSDPADTGTSSSGSGITFMISGAWSVLRLIFNLPSLFNTLLMDMSADFGIPVWFTSGIALIVMIIVIIGILMLILRGGE